jgi:type III pantothenate kinase
MVLVDIGNTNYHIWENGFIYHTPTPPQLEGEIYYISVNRDREEQFLKLNPTAVNLEDKVAFFSLYEGLGIDRKMACKTVVEGVVVDAGSAITIDIMEKGVHTGGIIMPGLGKMRELLRSISPKLDHPIEEVDFNNYPLNTREAVNWGTLGAVIQMIKLVQGEKPLYFTGGDGAVLHRAMGEGVYEPDLVFLGMIRTVEEWKRALAEERSPEPEWDEEPPIDLAEE